MARRNPSNNPSTTEEKSARLTRGGIRRLRGLLRYVRPYRLKFAVGLVCLALSSLTSLAFPFLFKEFINVANKEPGVPWLTSIEAVAVVLVGVLIAQAVFSFFRVLLFVEVSERSLADLRQDLYAHLIRLPLTFFNRTRVGELSSRISADIQQVKETFTTTLAELLRGVAIFVLGLSFIFVMSPKLTLIMLASLPVMIALAVVFGRFLRRLSKKTQESLAEANVVVEETLQGVQAVKAYTNEPFERHRYNRAIAETVRLALKTALARASFSAFIIVALFGTFLLITFFAAGMIENGSLKVGDFAGFLMYTAVVGGSMAGFSEQFAQLQRTVGATDRIQELLEEPAEPLPLENAPVPADQRLNGGFAFEAVRFAYPSRPEVTVLDALSFTAAPGEQVALVGVSGAGKSTIMALLLQFYAPNAGEISFDGRPAGSFALHHLRQQMAFVPQDILLFGGSIRENIAYGKLDATDADIEAAARQANAHEFISGFPEGYATVVGERGVQLSGGQRQRIAIARAILHDPVILLLDEATSALDSESERQVQEALDRLMRGRTTLVIAHRLATVRNADRILVLENGRLVEHGTHEELMGQPDGIYHHLAAQQFQESPLSPQAR